VRRKHDRKLILLSAASVAGAVVICLFLAAIWTNPGCPVSEKLEASGFLLAAVGAIGGAALWPIGDGS